MSAVATGTGVSPASGIKECVYVDSTHLAVYDLTGSPIAGNGTWWNGNSLTGVTPAQYLEALTPFTIPANDGPLGVLGENTGDLMRRLSLSPSNGLTSLATTGCPSACVASWQIGYDQSAGKFPLAAGQKFSITGTGTSLDTCGDGTASAGAQSPYTIASVTGSGASWTVASSPFACSISNSDYTHINPHCGPAATPNDTIGGTLDCTRVSQIAYSTNSLWLAVVGATLSVSATGASGYKSVFDGGSQYPDTDTLSKYANSAIRFLVDPTNETWLDQMIYALNNDYRGSGVVGYPVNTGAFVGETNTGFNYAGEPGALALMYGVVAHAAATSYWIASEQAAFLHRQYNDVDDPTGTPAIVTNQDAANMATHNWILSSGVLASGTNDATHVQLPVSDPHYGSPNYYAGTVIGINQNERADMAHQTYVAISAATSGTAGVLTLATAITPVDLKEIVSGTYTNGLTCTGTAGQVVSLQFNASGGTSYAAVTLTSSGTNSTTLIPAGAALSVWNNTSFTAAPTVSSSNPPGQANCTGAANVSTVLGTSYIIYDTVKVSTTTPGASATYTFTKTTNPGAMLSAGDAVAGWNGWGGNWNLFYYVSVVTGTGTSTATAINARNISASTSTPLMAWRFPKWQTGDVGRVWAMKRTYSNAYGVNGGVGGYNINANYAYQTGHVFAAALNGSGSDLGALPQLELVTAPDDGTCTGGCGAVRDLPRTQGYMFHYGMAPVEDLDTGRLKDGPGYSAETDAPTLETFMWCLTQSIPSFPSQGYGTVWGTKHAIFDMFETLPGAYLAGWAGGGMEVWQWASGGGPVTGPNFDPNLFYAPQSQTAAFLKNWAGRVNPGDSFFGHPEASEYSISFLHNDPRLASADYTTQPHQYFFVSSGSGSLTANTGWNHAARGDMAISRTGWQSAGDTYVAFDSATYTADSIYDCPRVGQLTIWKGALLLGSDSNPGNSCWSLDPTTVSDTFRFSQTEGLVSGQPTTPNGTAGVALTPITRYTNQTAGSFGGQYGDSASRFAAACSNIAPNYTTASLNIAIDHAITCFAHQKYPAVNGVVHDEFVWKATDVALAAGSPLTSTAMDERIHYVQNGTPQAGGPGYNSGATTYLGANRIESTEAGTTGLTYGLLSYIESPNPISINDDCAGKGGSGQCAPGNTYPNGQGYTHRFTIAGGASVGASVSKYQVVTCHKLMSSLTDTAFVTAAINPDSNWTGAACGGANSTGVALFALGGTMHSSITGFSVSSSLPVDWMVEGLSAGAYSVTVGGVAVSGSPFTVIDGDNSIEFSTSGGGTFAIGPPTSRSPTSMSGKASAGGQVVIH
jgi:hypothetical protein